MLQISVISYSGKFSAALENNHVDSSAMQELSLAEILCVAGGGFQDGSLTIGSYTLSNGGNWSNTFYQTAVWGGAGAIGGSIGGFAGAGIGAIGGAVGGFFGSFSLARNRA
jgi:hypothetical protein